MEYNNLYLHKHKDILNINPFDRNIIQQLLGYDKKEWDFLVKKTLEYLYSLLIEKDGQYYLPKGTYLYHGSLNYPFREGSQSKNNKNAMTFFGLDVTISLWYILELIQDLKYKNTKYKRFGYLYTFRLKEDIPITKIIDTIHQNPKDTFHCKWWKNSVCIGPQVSVRGNFDIVVPEIYSLSLELTLFYYYFKDYLEITDIYLVDPLALKINRNDYYFDPRLAIVERIETYNISEYDKELEKEIYDLYFDNYEDIYRCKYNCGFEGLYDDVLKHEKKHKKTFKK